MKNDELVEDSRAVLAHHAKSFRWASVLLPRAQANDAAIVYAFCRLADDTADEAPDPETARVGLDQLLLEFEDPTKARPLVREFAAIIDRCKVPKDVVRHLFDGLMSDLHPIRIKDDEALLHYCYQVAGTVGLIMCGVLNVHDRNAWRHAVDLGVGMQLSNICRDVHEDLGRDRVYLPASRLRQHGVEPGKLITAHHQPPGVHKVVLSLLELADQHYESADHGMRYIPLRARFAILAASRIYRGIGWKIRSRGGDVWKRRTYVGVSGKIRLMLSAVIFAPWVPLFRRRRHQAQLHQKLNGKLALPAG